MCQVHYFSGAFKSMLCGLCAGVLLVPVVFSAGCGGSAPKNDSGVVPEAGQAKPADSDVSKALAQLSPEDRKLAEKQRVCPVSDEPLGSMGVPVKATVKNRVVFLCCGGCEGELKKNADKYLAKLDK